MAAEGIRKGQIYGTVVVDLERRHVIDLLPDRTSATVAGGLRQRPGLEVDGAAVRAALTEPWSSGQAEGKVNRLKLLKRQNYGRASFDLLRRRILLAV